MGHPNYRNVENQDAINLHSVQSDKQNTSERTADTEPWNLPRYRLKTMLWITALMCVLLGVIVKLNLLAAIVFLVVLLLIVAHVFGNAIGTRLTNESSQKKFDGDESWLTRPTKDQLPLTPKSLAEILPLSRNIVLPTVVGSLLGCLVMLLRTIDDWDTIPLPGILILEFSGGLIGAYAGFLLSRWFSAIHRALKEAHRGSVESKSATENNKPQ